MKHVQSVEFIRILCHARRKKDEVQLVQSIPCKEEEDEIKSKVKKDTKGEERYEVCMPYSFTPYFTRFAFIIPLGMKILRVSMTLFTIFCRM